MAKDFTGITANKIAEATQEPQAGRKPRKTYNKQEATEHLQKMETTGRKGLKLPRLNLAFTPDIYDYVKTMSRACGMNYSNFISTILQQHMDEHREQYEQAVAFRNSL